MNPEPPQRLPEVLQVIALEDYEVEKNGFEPRSLYVEACWLPTLGPTATLLYRRLGTMAGEAAGVSYVDTLELSESMGLGHAFESKWSKLATGIGRLVRFQLAEWEDEQLAVRRAAPAVTGSRLKRLPPSSRMLHDRIMRTHLPEVVTLVSTRRAYP